MPTRNRRIKMRKQKYTTWLAKRICQAVADGNSINKICTDPKLIKEVKINVKASTVREWARDIPEFQVMLQQAYQDRADHYLDKFMEVMDEVESGGMSLKTGEFLANQQKWMLEKLHPEVVKSQQKGGTQTLSINANDGAAIQIILADPSKPQIKKETVDAVRIETQERQEERKEVQEGVLITSDESVA